MTLDPKSTLRFKGKDGNLYWFESTTGYCYLHEGGSGEEDRTFLCKTVDVIKSIWSAEKLPSDCCVGLPGGNHLHPSVTYDDLRYLEIFHGVQLRCLLGDPSLYQDYGVYLCRVYFPDRQEVVMEDIHTILERSKERFLDYSQRGILHACAPRSNQCAFDRRSTWDLQVIRSNPVFLYVFLIFSHFYYLSLRWFLITGLTRRWPTIATSATGNLSAKNSRMLLVCYCVKQLPRFLFFYMSILKSISCFYLDSFTVISVLSSCTEQFLIFLKKITLFS